MKGNKDSSRYKDIELKTKEIKEEKIISAVKTEVPHREVCYKILKEKGKPMHYKEITEIVLKESNSLGQTPQNTMFARMSTDTKERFKHLGKGVFALTEWNSKEAEKNAK